MDRLFTQDELSYLDEIMPGVSQNEQTDIKNDKVRMLVLDLFQYLRDFIIKTSIFFPKEKQLRFV